MKRSGIIFEDGDVIVASSNVNAVVWTRLNNRWHNSALGKASEFTNDASMVARIENRDGKNRGEWHFVGNLFKATPYDDCEHFTATFFGG